MKLSKIMLAVASVAIGSAAIAAPAAVNIGYSTGASATKGNLKNTLQNMCKFTNPVALTGATGFDLTEFASGSNVSTYVCSNKGTTLSSADYANASTLFRNFTGTQFAELRLNVSPGSFGSIRGYNGIFTDDLGANLVFREPSTATDRTQAQLIADRPGVVFVGGLSDVDPQGFPSTVTAGLTIPSTPSAGIQQAFGVAVSVPLYNEMFKSQRSVGAATVAKPIPSTCAADGSGYPLAATTADPLCVPTISKGQMAAIMSATDSNAAYAAGASFLASTLAADTELRYIRRPDTSGTQASAQNYFLGFPCSLVSNPVVAQPQSTDNEEVDGVSVAGFTPGIVDNFDFKVNNIRVLLAPGTGNVRQELSKPTIQGGAANYAIGVMSGENNQTVGNVFRWLRVQGAPMSENAAPANGQTNRDAVASGAYDFYYESVYTGGPTVAGAASKFFGPVTTLLKTAQGTGLVRVADQLYTKGGSVCATSTAN